ncbi:HPP family protein [Roseomonas xinghualingensis]|uniref:HPP family protein n=1 Tax=Roseomonas xinghualingensis TaxID=2986475 RepID=UPI0021F1B68C|nr:HPP family protein [Roseomonas sp. SXEYE001]MCV4207198.1 HPP family protein [Roseomonas sp. SXEYE001]
MGAMMAGLLGWLRGFLPAPLTASAMEQLRGSGGALMGVLVTGLICTSMAGTGGGLPMLMAPLGASAVLLFAVPASPLAQPWSIIGGNIVSALVGVTCATWIADPLLAAPLAAGLAIAAMFALRCLHPPGGAIALTAVLGGPAVTAMGYHFVLLPVALNSAVLMLAAIAFNNATRRPYPNPRQAPQANPHHTADQAPTARLGVSREDLDAVLRQHDQVLDVSRDDLEDLLQEAEMHAYRRRFGQITCADVMSRDVIAVGFETPLKEAWALLRRHDIRALPVIDPARRVVGMVSDTDFLSNPDLNIHEGLEERFHRMIRRARTFRTGRPEVVGRIMAAGIRTIPEDTHVAALVPLMADAGFRHIAVVDGEGRLSGIISQADLIAALYRGGFDAVNTEPAARAA